MNSITAIVPVKNLQFAKSRLSNILTLEQRISLVNYLINNTVSELKNSILISEIIIVSNDKLIKKFCQNNGVKFLMDSSIGINAAINLADSFCIQNGVYSNIVIPPDLPFISSKDIDLFCNISLRYPKCIVICPSKKYDGTNVLLRKPIDVIDVYYDNDSYNNHIQAAKKANIHIESLEVNNLMFDIDTNVDLMHLVKHSKIWENLLKSLEVTL